MDLKVWYSNGSVNHMSGIQIKLHLILIQESIRILNECQPLLKAADLEKFVRPLIELKLRSSSGSESDFAVVDSVSGFGVVVTRFGLRPLVVAVET